MHHLNVNVNGYTIGTKILAHLWFISCCLCHFETKELLGIDIDNTQGTVNEIISALKKRFKGSRRNLISSLVFLNELFCVAYYEII
jgi:hypothetical protein